MSSKKLEDKFLLLLDHRAAHPSAEVLQSKSEKIKTEFLPKNTTALIQSADKDIIVACKTYYCGDVLAAIVNSELQVTEFRRH